MFQNSRSLDKCKPSQLLAAVCSIVLLSGASLVLAAEPEQISLIRSQHQRLTVNQDIQRLAVGDPKLVTAEPLNNRELLLLGNGTGRTSLLIWFRTGEVREYAVTVHRDISLLQATLKRIYPGIEVEIATDRDAIVLTGTVPDITYSRAAEGAAHNYLDAAPNAAGRVLIESPSPATSSAPSPTDAAPAAQAVPQPANPATPVGGADTLRVPTTLQTSGTVINLLRIENLPPLIEEKILDGIKAVGGGNVTVRRILRGQIRDDTQDLFLLEGRVPNQVALTRVLTLAAQIVTGQLAAGAQNIRALTDEAGGMLLVAGGAAGGGGTGGGASGGSLNNQIQRNVARAKILTAGGRVLSFLSVADIPQIRVNIRLFEVNRSKLRTFGSNLTAQVGKQISVAPGTLAQSLSGTTATPVGPGHAVQTLLGFLGGTLSTETQLTAGRFALDSVLSYLDQIGVTRSLSSPSLTVLSGETANFQVGGSVPISESVSIGTVGVSSNVIFQQYGITLNVRPLVGDDDMLTIDVSPTITTPDSGLTSTIRTATGNNQPTVAFQSRSLFTSARLQDGQALLVGGLLSRNTGDNQSSTPGLRDVPGLGWLFKNQNNSDDSTELVIVIDPAIIRDTLPNVGLWEYPATAELMQTFGRDGLTAGPRQKAPLPVAGGSARPASAP